MIKKTLFNESLVQANVWCTCTKPSFIETSPTFNLENGNGGKQDSRSVSGQGTEGGEQVFGSTDLALKSAWIVDLCTKSSGFADFENTVDRGSAVIFDADCGLCLSYVRILGPNRNLDHRSFFSLDQYVNELIQIISSLERLDVHLNSGVRRL